jgi:GntR family transcriptional regulator
MFKRSPSLTEQAKAYIKQCIVNQDFEAGRIPSETDLANKLGVSRTTIRDALSRLELEGVIFRKQGAGTFINEAGLAIKTRLEEIWSYETMLQAHGYTPSVQILKVETFRPPTSIAADLNLATTDKLLSIQKLFLADGNPVILTINHLPLALITADYNKADFYPPIYHFLSTFCQQYLSYYLSEIVPLNTPAWLGEILGLPARRAILSFEEIGYNQDNEPILKASSYFQDNFLRLRLIRREGHNQ